MPKITLEAANEEAGRAAQQLYHDQRFTLAAWSGAASGLILFAFLVSVITAPFEAPSQQQASSPPAVPAPQAAGPSTPGWDAGKQADLSAQTEAHLLEKSTDKGSQTASTEPAPPPPPPPPLPENHSPPQRTEVVEETKAYVDQLKQQETEQIPGPGPNANQQNKTKPTFRSYEYPQPNGPEDWVNRAFLLPAGWSKRYRFNHRGQTLVFCIPKETEAEMTFGNFPWLAVQRNDDGTDMDLYSHSDIEGEAEITTIGLKNCVSITLDCEPDDDRPKPLLKVSVGERTSTPHSAVRLQPPQPSNLSPKLGGLY